MKVDGQDKKKYSFIVRLPKSVKSAISVLIVILLLLTSIIAVFISKRDEKLTTSITTSVTDIAAPVLKYTSYPIKKLSDFVDLISNYYNYSDKINVLKERNTKLEELLIQYSNFAIQNKELKDLLNFVDANDYQKITAQMVGNSSGSFNRTILVSVRNDENIKKGQAVVSSTGLVGRVIQVGKRSSRIMLITDIRSKIPVKSNLSQEKSILLGNNTKDPQLVFMNKDHKLKEGEVVMTSGDGNLFPPDLLIGKVYKDSSGSFFVKPFVKWHLLNFLSIIIYDNES